MTLRIGDITEVQTSEGPVSVRVLNSLGAGMYKLAAVANSGLWFNAKLDGDRLVEVADSSTVVTSTIPTVSSTVEPTVEWDWRKRKKKK